MEISLVYPHQLYKEHPALDEKRPVFLIEEPLLYGSDSKWPLEHHARRQALLREAGVLYVDGLVASGYKAEIIEIPSGQAHSCDLLDKLPGKLSTIHVAKVVDDLISRRLQQWCDQKGIDLLWYETPNFPHAGGLVARIPGG